VEAAAFGRVDRVDRGRPRVRIGRPWARHRASRPVSSSRRRHPIPEPVVLPTTLADVLLIAPTPIADERGFFVRTMSSDVLATAGIDSSRFVQENQSRSRRNTLRGFHMRRALSEAKIARCARGAVLEVVVDLRPWSATFTRWESFELDDVSHHQVYVPAGCAHAFLVLSDWADICYKHDAVYAPELEAALAWNDPELAVPWPIADPFLSERDRTAPTLAEIRGELATWYGSERPELNS
jgi:dTDP-4-dehydrorhamnose 3,5-epimerase